MADQKSDWRKDPFEQATVAARVVLNFRREEIDAVARGVFEDNERRLFLSFDPRRILDEIHRRLKSVGARPLVVEFESSTQRRVRLMRHGATNVIRLYPAGMDGHPEAIVLHAARIRDLVREQKRKELEDLTFRPVANDTDPNSDEIRMSRRMSVRMAMKGRLARIMGESKAGAS